MTTNDWVAIGKLSTLQRGVPRGLRIYPEADDEFSAWEYFDLLADDGVEPIGVYQISSRTLTHLDLCEDPEKILSRVEDYLKDSGISLSLEPPILQPKMFPPGFISFNGFLQQDQQLDLR